MALDDGSSWDSPLYLSIRYVPSDKSKTPTKKEAEAAFARVLNVLEDSLKE